MVSPFKLSGWRFRPGDRGHAPEPAPTTAGGTAQSTEAPARTLPGMPPQRARRVLQKPVRNPADRPINTRLSGPTAGNIGNPRHTVHQLTAQEAQQVGQALGHLPPTGTQAAPTPQQREQVRQTLELLADDLANDMGPYGERFLAELTPSCGLSAEEITQLQTLARQARLTIAHEPLGPGESAPALRLFFAGSDRNLHDIGLNAKSLMGRTGSNDKAAREVGRLFARMLARDPAPVQLRLVSGLSMGGAAAQTFMAAIDARNGTAGRPPVILLDPLLLNNRQARSATKGGTEAVDYARPRGLVVTLDYAQKPRRGAMEKLKAYLGYESPGLAHLKLGLDDHDGEDNGPPRLDPEFGKLNWGYHGDLRLYGQALTRFSASQQTSVPQQPPPALPPSLPQGRVPGDRALRRLGISAGEAGGSTLPRPAPRPPTDSFASTTSGLTDMSAPVDAAPSGTPGAIDAPASGNEFEALFNAWDAPVRNLAAELRLPDE
jgi:hypothetical protein